MSSSQAVSRTEGPNTTTWEVHKETINDLYIKDNMPLKDVMDIMRNRHGLVASGKMYKYRLKTWGIRKNSPIKCKDSGVSDPDPTLSSGSGPVTRTSSPALPSYPMPTGPLDKIQAGSPKAAESILRMLNSYFSNLDDPWTTPYPYLTPQERHQSLWQRNRASMERLQTYDPHSSREMTLINYFMNQITAMAKQREYWSFVQALHLLHQFSLTPGSEAFIIIMIKQYRDALLIYLEPGHPFGQMWSQVVDQVVQQQKLHGAPTPGIIPHSIVDVYTRCIDDHLRSRFGRLSYTYQEAHLRMLINVSRPRDFAAEVSALLDAGFSASAMHFLLESIFVEKLMNECVHIELQRFFVPPPPPPQSSSSSASSCSAGGEASSDVPSAVGAVPTQKRSFFEHVVDEDDDGGLADLRGEYSADRAAVVALVRLVRRLRVAVLSNKRVGPDELRRIKLEAVSLGVGANEARPNPNENSLSFHTMLD